MQLNIILLWSDYCRDVEGNRVSKFIEASIQYSHHDTVGDLTDETQRYLKAFIERKRHITLDTAGSPLKLWLLPFETEKNIWFNTLRQGCTFNSSYDYKLYMDGELM